MTNFNMGTLVAFYENFADEGPEFLP